MDYLMSICKVILYSDKYSIHLPTLTLSLVQHDSKSRGFVVGAIIMLPNSNLAIKSICCNKKIIMMFLSQTHSFSELLLCTVSNVLLPLHSNYLFHTSLNRPWQQSFRNVP